MAKIIEARKTKRKRLVSSEDIPHFGTMFKLETEERAPVVLLTTPQGGHNGVPTLEGVQDVIKNVFERDR
jgi:hypothetical protein